MTEPSNSEILRAIGDLEGTVRAIGAKLDDHQNRMNVHSARLERLATEQARLSTRLRHYGATAGAIAAGLVTIVLAAFKDLLSLD